LKKSASVKPSDAAIHGGEARALAIKRRVHPPDRRFGALVRPTLQTLTTPRAARREA